jgi:uncharacterized membrane protein
MIATATPPIPSPLLEQTMEQAIGIIRPNFHLGWDLFLALIPLGLSLLIFRHNNRIHPLLWWLLLGVMVLFLPNAPYVLTDVIHFVSKVRVTPPLPIWAMSLLLLEFFFYFLIGMQSFTLSLMLWGRKLKRHRAGWLILPIELIILGLSAFAMYLGRFDRLNSWNILSAPEKLLDQSLKEAVTLESEEITLIFFVVITFVFYALKLGNHLIAKLLQHHHPHSSQQGSAD